jgi:hypothetical protein
MAEFSDESTFQEKLLSRNFIIPEEVLVAPNMTFGKILPYTIER